MGNIADLNKFLIPLGYYVSRPKWNGGFIIHDSISHEELRRVSHIEDILWYMVDHCDFEPEILVRRRTRSRED